MSTIELAKLIGRRCLVCVGKLRFPCHIVDASRQYGHDRVKVEPLAGTGADWRNLDAVKLLGKEGE